MNLFTFGPSLETGGSEQGAGVLFVHSRSVVSFTYYSRKTPKQEQQQEQEVISQPDVADNQPCVPDLLMWQQHMQPTMKSRVVA